MCEAIEQLVLMHVGAVLGAVLVEHCQRVQAYSNPICTFTMYDALPMHWPVCTWLPVGLCEQGLTGCTVYSSN